jgi:hypothetical protein
VQADMRGRANAGEAAADQVVIVGRLQQMKAGVGYGETILHEQFYQRLVERVVPGAVDDGIETFDVIADIDGKA